MAENYFASTLPAPRLGRRLALCVGVAFGLAALMHADGGRALVVNSLGGMAITALALLAGAFLLDVLRVGQGVRGRSVGTPSAAAALPLVQTLPPSPGPWPGNGTGTQDWPAPAAPETLRTHTPDLLEAVRRPLPPMPPAVAVADPRGSSHGSGDPRDLLHALADDPLSVDAVDPSRITSSPRGMLPTPEEVRDAVSLLFGRPYAEVYAMAQDPLTGSSVHDLHAMAEEWVWRQKESEHTGDAPPPRPMTLPRFGEAFDHAALLPRYRATV